MRYCPLFFTTTTTSRPEEKINEPSFHKECPHHNKNGACRDGGKEKEELKRGDWWQYTMTTKNSAKGGAMLLSAVCDVMMGKYQFWGISNIKTKSNIIIQLYFTQLYVHTQFLKLHTCSAQ